MNIYSAKNADNSEKSANNISGKEIFPKNVF